MLEPSCHPPSSTRTWVNTQPIKGSSLTPHQWNKRYYYYCPARVVVVGLCSVINFILGCPPFISVMVSVLSIEGTDCRLDELGRLADRTGGKVRDYF